MMQHAVTWTRWTVRELGPSDVRSSATGRQPSKHLPIRANFCKHLIKPPTIHLAPFESPSVPQKQPPSCLFTVRAPSFRRSMRAQWLFGDTANPLSPDHRPPTSQAIGHCPGHRFQPCCISRCHGPALRRHLPPRASRQLR